MIEAPSYFDSPVLHDKVIQDLQQAFAAKEWVGVAFPLASTITDDGRTFPAVWNGEDYVEITPDDDHISICYFELIDSERLDDEDEWFRYNLAFVFWFQLSEVYSKSYDYTSEMIQLAKNVLKENGCYSMKYTIVPGDVFEGYTELEQSALIKGNSCFKIEFIKEN